MNDAFYIGVAGGASITNAGSISADGFGLRLGETDDDASANVLNSGTITSLTATGVFTAMGSGIADVTNTGTIQSAYAGVWDTSARYDLHNSGVIQGNDSGITVAHNSTVINTGSIIGLSYLGAEVDVVRNSGFMDDIFFRGGDDVYRGRNGEVGDIDAGFGNDIIETGVGHDFVDGGDGDDTLIGRGGDDELYGYNGDDLIVAGTGDDLVYGGVGHDVMRGQNGDDELFGSNGKDTLVSGNGDDYLHGGNHDDTLRGDGGNDVLVGAHGKDTFVFTLDDGADQVKDFEDGNDKLDLRDLSLGSFGADISSHLSETTAGVVLDLMDSHGVRIHLDDIAISDLSGADFIL